MYKESLTSGSAGPAAEEQKVYMSAATLLVLPPTLIPHWLHQIKTHMEPNTLRVAVVTSDSTRAQADAPEQGTSQPLMLYLQGSGSMSLCITGCCHQ